MWFLWGGIKDTFAFYRDLCARSNNPLDNGMVKGHVAVHSHASKIPILGKFCHFLIENRHFNEAFYWIATLLLRHITATLLNRRLHIVATGI